MSTLNSNNNAEGRPAPTASNPAAPLPAANATGADIGSSKQDGLVNRGPSTAQTPLQESSNSQSRPQNEALRADPTKYGQAYSERNPPPNIQAFQEHQQKRQEASRRYFETNDSKADAKQDKTKDERPDTDDAPKAGETDDVPIGAEKSNVLFNPTPDVNLDLVFDSISMDLRRVSYIVFGAVIVLDWLFIGGGFMGFLKSFLPAGGVATAVYLVLNMVGSNAAKRKVDQAETKTEKLKYVPESVEWMNSLVETLWDTLQQDFFDNIASQINDTIKPYIPESVPATVKITELGHGSQSLRVLSMRSLPDSEFGALVPSHGTDKSGSVEQAQEREKAVEREEGGVFYNLEIAVAYHEPPFRTRKEHMHVDVLAMIGPVPVPVYVQVKEFVATIRVRLQMHPDLPFLKNVTFALTESPKINACVSLGAPWALDLLNLPIIDSVLVSQINTAAADFVQPKSMSMDMTLYIGGSDQKEETEAIGVLVVKIHRARNLARQDSRGPGADPYLTIAFSKYEKPMYATRIIKGDRNPVWEESAIIMIRSEHVKRQENVLLRLWDSDTTGSDDISGVCEFPLHELVLNSNKMHKREDQLQGDTAGTDAEGILEWEIGYFPRAQFQKELRTDATDPRDHHGEKQEVAEEEKVTNAHNTVPDPNLPSGILGLTIHQCINVQVDNPNKKSMGHVKVRGQDSDGEDDAEEETISIDYIPSLYVSADINDKLNYRTRVKNITNSPTFNSSHETYIRDWRMATLTLSVWDTRKKSDDCLVGVVALKLSELFHESSSIVKFYDLKGGEGTGRIRVSMIFRSIGMKLEESLLGYDIGSFAISSPIVCTGDGINTRKLTLRTAGSQRTIKGGEKSEGGYTWNLDEKQSLLPVHYRYMSPLVLELAGITQAIPGPLGKKMNKNKHFAILWLYKLTDNQEQEFVLPIYKTDNPNRLTQNVVSESDATMKLEKVGEVKFRGKFKAGLDESHEEFLGKGNYDHWSAYQSWVAARKSGEVAHDAGVGVKVKSFRKIGRAFAIEEQIRL
ncbi:Meiotically up-regulated [Hyphodiscus hymeniophilus]|uniref:Meiotically up-regulated n=1 Tax=Hyphodiscus hymeniophilus TaxID=353542 RepID=A0A9P7AVU5_9HELO|nr:Meiotically up-regulated [Hyphodiscus hymeniophilus]